MSLLERLHTAAKPKKTAWMFYGPAGIGKTSLAAQFPKVAFVPDGFDDGINDLKRTGQCSADVPVFDPLQSKDDLWKVTKALMEEPGLEEKIQWVVFDNLSGIQEHIWRHRIATVQEYKGSRDKFLDYGKGPSASEQDVREWCQMLSAVCSRGIGVILLAHSGTKTDPNPTGESFEKIVPLVDKKFYEAVRQWCPNIGYIGQDAMVEKEGLKNKAAAVDIRTLRFTPIPAVDAKNRFGITQPILMGMNAQEAFNNLMTAVRTHTKGETK